MKIYPQGGNVLKVSEKVILQPEILGVAIEVARSYLGLAKSITNTVILT